ncbi:hypothetical protein BpHYR1_011849 [Brachionus plicatilis]|uniref:Uncharacterized protein n=1 Tax=Brachionus plicatilis TaxID=10195 RepID=A0A3M7RD98_BRAPC|nr:hypothetical protein BpHYR1_011849 [Brachionus plicatilis]
MEKQIRSSALKTFNILTVKELETIQAPQIPKRGRKRKSLFLFLLLNDFCHIIKSCYPSYH